MEKYVLQNLNFSFLQSLTFTILQNCSTTVIHSYQQPWYEQSLSYKGCSCLSLLWHELYLSFHYGQEASPFHCRMCFWENLPGIALPSIARETRPSWYFQLCPFVLLACFLACSQPAGLISHGSNINRWAIGAWFSLNTPFRLIVGIQVSFKQKYKTKWMGSYVVLFVPNKLGDYHIWFLDKPRLSFLYCILILEFGAWQVDWELYLFGKYESKN